MTAPIMPANIPPMGRLAPHPEITHPRLKLGLFVQPGTALDVPSSVDYLSKVTAWPGYFNASLKDCTAAAAGHQREVWTRYGQLATITTTDADVLRFYERCSGYRIGDPSSDRGAIMQDCLDVWRRTGLGRDRILAFFQLDHTNLAEVKTALWLLGGVYVGVNFPRSAMTQFNNRQPWDYNPGLDNTIEGGHCVHLGAIDATGMLTVTTWGQTQQVTPAWWAQFVEEAWCSASQSWMRAGLSPAGLDTAKINMLFANLTGEPGPFPATPAPATIPASVPDPTDPTDVMISKIWPWVGGWHIPGTRAAEAAEALTVWRQQVGKSS